MACLVASLALLDSDIDSQNAASTRQAGIASSATHLRVATDDERMIAARKDASQDRGRRGIPAGPAADRDAVSTVVLPETETWIEPLRDSLARSDAQVRLKAVSVLADIDNEQAKSALATVVLTDSDSAVRQEAVFALSEAEHKFEMTVLEQALTDPDDRVREAAIEAFSTIGGDESARALAVAMHDGNAALRREVVDALGEIGGETAIRLLQEAMTDEQLAVRESAAEWLTELD